MTDRAIPIVAGAACLAMVFAQDVVPEWGGFHTWPYAAALALAIVLVGAAFRRASTAGGLAVVGTIVIGCAGLGSGLLGPDSEVVARAPGTVAPLPDAGAAAFFPNVDALDISRGDARVTVRRRDGASFELGLGERRYLGASVIALRPERAAYVEAYDAKGRHLTITQPTNPAFLSPIVLFAQRVTIAGRSLPADSFATPAVRRQIKIFYFSKDDSEAGRMHGVSGSDALLFAVDDDADHPVPRGIGFARSGSSTILGGLRLRGTIGSYPALVVSAVPYVPALAAGALLLGAAVLVWLFRRGEMRVTSAGTV